MTLLLRFMRQNFRPFPSIWLNLSSHRAFQKRHQSHTAKSAKTFLRVFHPTFTTFGSDMLCLYLDLVRGKSWRFAGYGQWIFQHVFRVISWIPPRGEEEREKDISIPDIKMTNGWLVPDHSAWLSNTQKEWFPQGFQPFADEFCQPIVPHWKVDIQ